MLFWNLQYLFYMFQYDPSLLFSLSKRITFYCQALGIIERAALLFHFFLPLLPNQQTKVIYSTSHFGRFRNEVFKLTYIFFPIQCTRVCKLKGLKTHKLRQIKNKFHFYTFRVREMWISRAFYTMMSQSVHYSTTTWLLLIDSRWRHSRSYCSKILKVMSTLAWAEEDIKFQWLTLYTITLSGFSFFYTKIW